MSPQVATMRTLRKSSGGRFMSLSSIRPAATDSYLAVDRGGDDQRAAENDGTDDDRQRGVLVVFNLFAHRKRRHLCDHEEGDCKGDQSQENKYDCRNEDRQECFDRN